MPFVGSTRYFQAPGSYDFQKWRDVACLFPGKIDVRSLGRALPAGAPVWRTVESVTVSPHLGGAVIEIRAPSFVWGMVRKIVATFREVDAGRVSIDRLEEALQGRARLTLPIAEPEPLLLWDVEYPLPWENTWAGPNRHQLAWEKAVRENLSARQAFLEAFSTLTPRGG